VLTDITIKGGECNVRYRVKKEQEIEKMVAVVTQLDLTGIQLLTRDANTLLVLKRELDRQKGSLLVLKRELDRQKGSLINCSRNERMLD